MCNRYLTGLLPRYVFMLGVVILGSSSLAFRQLLDGLQPAPEGWGGCATFAVISGVALVGGSLAIGWHRSKLAGAITIATIFILYFLFLQLPAMLTAKLGLPALVAPIECLCIAVTGLALAYPGAQAASRLLLGAMLLLFGAVHLSQSAFIASLIPDWMPFREIWPWVTGTTMMLTGLALVGGKFICPAATVAATMFLLWLPLVHVGRIIATPASPSEWVFAATAIVLAGCLLLTAGDDAEPSAAKGGSPSLD